MKKPKIIYAIALWSFFQTSIYVSIPVGILGNLFQLPPDLFRIIKGSLQIAVVIILVGMVQLRRLPRIANVAFLIIACLLIIKMLLTALFDGMPHGSRFYLSFILFLIVNALCIWYLLKGSFIDFSSKYREEIELNKRFPYVK